MDPLRLWSMAATAAIHGAVVVAVVVFSGRAGAADDRPKLADMVTIEAALAYKSQEKTTNQPQKPRRRAKPPPRSKPVKVSRDETQAPKQPAPEEPAPEEPAPEEPEEDFAAEFEKYREMRQTGDEPIDDGLPVGDEPARAGGTFDGSEHGFAELDKGDPYMRELAGDANRFWVVPTLERGSGTAVGCVQLGEDGRVLDTQLLPPTENATVDAAVKRALKKLTEVRADGSKPVPEHLAQATTEWICFKFPY